MLSIVPFGLGGAVNPTALTVELPILTGKHRPKARAWAYLLGFTVVLIGFVDLFMTVLGRMTRPIREGEVWSPRSSMSPW